MICLTTTEAFDLRLMLLNISAAVGQSQTNSNPPPDKRVKLLTHSALDLLHDAEMRKEHG